MSSDQIQSVALKQIYQIQRRKFRIWDPLSAGKLNIENLANIVVTFWVKYFVPRIRSPFDQNLNEGILKRRIIPILKYHVT